MDSASKLRCIVVDDEDMSRDIIKKFVDQTDFLELAGACSSAIEAASLLRKEKVDLIFLDIEMPEMSGMDLLKTLKEKPQIILTTSEKKYAVEAFEYEVADYLLKPLNYTRFLKAVNKVNDSFKPKETQGSGQDENIFVKIDSKLVKINKNDIFFIEALGDYVVINTSAKKYTVFSTMKSLEHNLPEHEFLRVHRSYIIRVDKIMDIQDSNLVIKEKVIPIGPSYKNELMKRLRII